MKHLHPNTRKYLTFGLFPVRSSYGVFSNIVRRKSQFDAWHAVLTASAQNLCGDSNVQNVSIISACSMPLLGDIAMIFIHFHTLFDHIWTNLLTQCTPAPVSVFCCFCISGFP